MLTGRLAYLAKNRQELTVAFREQTPPPPSQFNSEVKSEIDEIVLKMITIDPKERYASAEIVAEALRSSKSNYDKYRYYNWQFIKTIRKHQKSLATGLLMLVLLICISVFTYFMYMGKNDNNSGEVQQEIKNSELFADDFSDFEIDGSLWKWERR